MTRSPGRTISGSTMTRAARLAFAAFIRAGCRRLAVLNSDLGTPSLAAREAAFVAQARKAKLDVTVIREGGMTSYENGLDRRAQAVQRPSNGRTRVFCVNDLLACAGDGRRAQGIRPAGAGRRLVHRLRQHASGRLAVPMHSRPRPTCRGNRRQCDAPRHGERKRAVSRPVSRSCRRWFGAVRYESDGEGKET